MKKRTLQSLSAAIGLCLLASSSIAVADEVRVSVKDKARRSLQEDLPVKGLSESSVINRWGEPQSVTGPIGQPSIYQWHYPDFTVYLEGNRVIHSVIQNDR